MAEDPAEAAVQAVAVKLPPFWPEQPRVWFAQVEAQFDIRGITADTTRYHYVVAALDQGTAARVLDILESPPAADKYKTLKDRLLDSYALTEYERATRLLHIQGLGDAKPSCLMDRMLSLLGTHRPCFLFRQIFLEQMPEHIRGPLIQSNINDERELAKVADRLWLARAETQLVHATTGRNPQTLVNKQSSSQTDQRCYYHRRYGNKAHKCIPPCSMSSQLAPKSGPGSTHQENSSAGCL